MSNNNVGTTIVLNAGDYYLYFVFHMKRIERIGLDFVCKYNKFDGHCEIIDGYDELKKLYNEHMEELYEAIRESVIDEYQPIFSKD